MYSTEDDPKEFPGLRLAEQSSFQETDEWLEAWSAVDHRCLEAERRACLVLYINLDDDAGPSSRPRKRGDPGQGCSRGYLPPPKQEELSDNQEEDYAGTM